LEEVEAGRDFFGAEALAPAFHARMAALDEYLPDDARWIVLDPSGVKEAADRELRDALDRFEHRRADHRVALEPKEHYLEYDQLVDMLDRAPSRMDAEPVEVLGEETPSLRFPVEDNRALAAELTRARAEKADELLRPLVSHLRALREEGFRVAFICAGVHGGERLRGLLRGYDVETELHREPGANGLFELPAGGKPHIFLGPLT